MESLHRRRLDECSFSLAFYPTRRQSGAPGCPPRAKTTMSRLERSRGSAACLAFESMSGAA
jgi:hypothetical protein